MGRRFATTHWSAVLAAGRREEPEADRALAELCETYWYPLYAYARRRGHDADSAGDLTQGFFAEFLAKGWVEAADPERGRFRTFLLVAFRRYAAKERERAGAARRGGGRRRIGLDLLDGERRYALEPSHELTAERVYLRRWALTVLASVREQLGHEMRAAGKEELFEVLGTGVAPAGGYRAAAERLGTTEGALKVAAHRLRRRTGRILRERIAGTLREPDDVDEEIAELLRALGG